MCADGQLVKVLGEVEAVTSRVPNPWVGAFLPSDRGRCLPFFVVTGHNDGSEHTLDYSNNACAFSRGGILSQRYDAAEGEAGVRDPTRGASGHCIWVLLGYGRPGSAVPVEMP